MIRRIAVNILQYRGLKNQVKINWVRPEYVPAYKPQRSGDLEALPPISPQALGNDYANSEEIKDAPEAIKKLFSLEFLGRKEFNIAVKKAVLDRVRRHKFDESTEEARIAILTAQIRCLQDILEKWPKDVVSKVCSQELIDKRKKFLKFLRQSDYKKFEWLLEKLNIEYKGHPDSFHKLSRKESLRKLTELHCEDVRNKKLNDYRNLLESQQGPFLKKKLEALQFIKSEQEDLKLPVTVTDKDIANVNRQLEEWTIKDEIKRQAKKKKKNMMLDL